MFGLTAHQCFLGVICIFALSYWLLPKKYSWVSFLLTAVLMGVIAYHIEFYDSDDMSIYFHHLDVFRENGKSGIDYALHENWFEWRTYKTSLYYFYFISKLPSNYYLPAITIFLVYGLGFLILFKAARRFSCGKLYLFYAAMFFLSTYWYYDTASGTRNGITFAMGFACVYQHIVERKHIPLCFAGYILTLFMHSTGILVVSIGLVAMLTLNSSGKYVNALLFFGLIMGGGVLRFLSARTENSFIQSVAGKAETHGWGESLETGTMFRVNLTVAALLVLLLIYFSYYLLYSNTEEENYLHRLYKLSSITLYFVCGAALSGLIFVRFVRFILPIVGGLIIMVGLQLQREQIGAKGIKYLKQNPMSSISIRYKLRPLVLLVLFLYTGVHLWYLFAGSSLHWMRFPEEIL
jgi:hypothetical protein